jgi:tetratricopeptide (TPR) repeat protein
VTGNPAPAGADEQARAGEQADVAEVIAYVRSEVKRAGFGGGVAAAKPKLLQPLRRTSEYGPLRRNMVELQHDLSKFLAILKEAHDRLDRVEQMRADSERFGTVWWRQRQRSISEQPSPEQQSAEWVTVFAEALLAERFDVCARLASSEYPSLPDDELLVRLARTGAQALDEGRWAAAAPLLRLLVDGPGGKMLPPPHRASIELLLARILMPIAAERSGVRRRLEEALARPGENDAECALFAVGLGECSLAAGDLAAAVTWFEQAEALNPGDPAPYIGLGLVEEQRRTWFTAMDQYDQAAARAPDGQALARLRAPVSGNLYWRLAIKLADVEESLEVPDPKVPAERRQAALEAIDTALRLGISGRGESPERRALIYRAGLLESLGRSQEAAAAYYDAALRFQPPTEDAVACKHLEKACDLGPTVPVYHWALADVLRRLAYGEGGRADSARLEESIQRWRAGAAIRQPAPEEAWAYVTLAFAKTGREVSLKRSTLWEAAALTERAVLLDGTYALGWAALALVHNMIGNPRTALAAANRALAEDSSESMALEERTLALAYLERVDEAAQAAKLLANGSTSGLWPRLYALLVARQFDMALTLFSNLPVESDAALRWYRAVVNKWLNHDADETEDLRWIWEHRDDDLATDPGNVAWAAYRLGYYDSAEERYRQILDVRDQSVLNPNAACDLGQLLLERGDAPRQDFANGEALLKAGIDQHTLSSLGMLEEVELPQLLRRVAGKPHADRVAAIAGDVLALLHERRAALADPSVTPEVEMRWALDPSLTDQAVSVVAENLDDGPADPAAGVGPADPAAGDGAWRSARRQAAYAALGSLGIAQKRWRDAAEAYVALGQEGLPEDAAVGYARAVAAMRAEADETARSGDLDLAREHYGWLAEQVAAHSPAAQGLRSGLLCRVAMASAASGDADAARSNFEAAVGPLAGHAEGCRAEDAADGPRALARIFAGSAPAFWAQTDTLTSLRADPALTEGARALVDAILAALSLDDAYRTHSSDVDSSATFPLTNAVVLSLGTSLMPGDTDDPSPLRRTLLPQIRNDIEQEYGIRVPGIRLRKDATLAPTGFEVLLDGVTVREGEIPEARSSPVEAPPLDDAVAGLKDALIGNLARLLGPDDLATWAAPSAPATPEDGVVQVALSDAETRLRIQRVLRLLLREGVPVTDRHAVLAAIATAVTDGADTVTALRNARLRLARALPGTGPGPRPEQLPAALESAVAQHLRAECLPGMSRPAWQAPCAEADKLVEQLQEYFSSLPAGAAVFVRDPGVRCFVVRLLAGARLRRHVVTKDELEAAARLGPDVVDASAEESAR